MKLCSYESLYPNVNKKGFYFIWEGSESRMAKLKQWVDKQSRYQCGNCEQKSGLCQDYTILQLIIVKGKTHILAI